MQELLEDKSCTRILKQFEVYLESLRDAGSLSAFWVSYLSMAEIVLGLIRASREGNYIIFININCSNQTDDPWCFTYDKVNYARFLTYYYATMSRLPIEHPEVHAHFMQGGFSGQKSTHLGCQRHPDIRRHQRFQPERWSCGKVLCEYSSRHLRQLRNMIGQRDTDFSHPDLQLPRMRRDEADMQSLVQLMETSLLNPFSYEDGELVSLSTAAKDLLEAYKMPDAWKHTKLSSKSACKKMLHLRSSMRR